MSLAVIERMEARPPFKIATSGTAGGIEPLPLSVSIEERPDSSGHHHQQQQQQQLSPNHYNSSSNNNNNNNHHSSYNINNNNNNPTTTTTTTATATTTTNNNNNPPLSSPLNTNDYGYLDMTMSLKSHGSGSIVDDSQKSWDDGKGQGFGHGYRVNFTQPVSAC